MHIAIGIDAVCVWTPCISTMRGEDHLSNIVAYKILQQILSQHPKNWWLKKTKNKTQKTQQYHIEVEPGGTMQVYKYMVW